MSDYQWSPPEHPMPTPEKVVSLDPDPEAVDLDPQPPVWFDVVFELRGAQRVVGFAMKASPTRVFAQMQFMSHTHYAWEAGDPFLERYQRLTQVIALAESSQGGDEAGDHAAEERERVLGFGQSGGLADDSPVLLACAAKLALHVLH